MQIPPMWRVNIKSHCLPTQRFCFIFNGQERKDFVQIFWPYVLLRRKLYIISWTKNYFSHIPLPLGDNSKTKRSTFFFWDNKVWLFESYIYIYILPQKFGHYLLCGFIGLIRRLLQLDLELLCLDMYVNEF